MALCRNVHFSDYAKNPLTQAAVSELSHPAGFDFQNLVRAILALIFEINDGINEVLAREGRIRFSQR
jgi:hypothetical protein